MDDVAILRLLPAIDVAQRNQSGAERNVPPALLEPAEQIGWIAGLDLLRNPQALAEPADVRSFGHHSASRTTSITSSTSSSLKCGYIGSEKICCAFFSATGNWPAR